MVNVRSERRAARNMLENIYVNRTPVDCIIVNIERQNLSVDVNVDGLHVELILKAYIARIFPYYEPLINRMCDRQTSDRKR